jgi:PEGA domain
MTKHPLHLLAVCAAVITCAPALTSHPALAQQPDDAAKLAQSRAYFDQANKLFDAGQYPQAEQAYLAAFNLKKSYDVAGNLGMIEADLNHLRSAAEHLAYAIQEFPAGGRPGLREALLKRLTEVRRSIGAFRIQVNKPGAEVLVDGKSIGLTPIQGEIFVEPGPHAIEVRLDGFTPVPVSLTAVKGQTNDVPVTLEPVVVVVPVAGANKKVLIAGGVVGGAAIIAGAALMGLSASKGSSATSLFNTFHMPTGCPPPSSATGNCATLASDLNAKATFGNAGLGLLVAGGVVGVATLIYGVASPRATTAPAPATTGLRVLPVVTGEGGGLLVNGTF